MDALRSPQATEPNSATPPYPLDAVPVPLPVPIDPYGASGYLLGVGGMGVVYRVRSRLEDRDVALKVMRPDLARRDPNARARFLREARSLSQVRHENVVAIYYVGETAGVPYFVMPLLDGETLEQYLERQPGGRPPLGEVLRIGREAAAGLAAAHGQGLVHRDIKPSNLWLEAPTGRVKVLDFGLARAARPPAGEALSGGLAVVGTPPYMSPEQLDGRPVDARTDLFSLGTVLYQMATGVRPFRGATFTQLSEQIARLDPPAPRLVHPAVPAGLSRLIEELLAKDPAARPATAAEVERRLAVLARPSRRGVLVGAAAFVLGGGAATAWWLGQRAPALAPSLEPPRFDFDVTVWKAGRHDRKGRRLGDPGTLPLGPGDAIRLEATADRPVYFYLVWLQADGTLVPGHPWDNEDWAQRNPAERPASVLNVPGPADAGFTLEGAASGVEAFVLLARDEPLLAGLDLRSLLAEWRASGGADDDLAVAAWVEHGRLARGSGRFSATASLNNPVGVVRRMTESLREGHGLASRAVCFGYQARVDPPDSEEPK